MVLLTQHECVGNGGRLTAGLLAKARAQKHLKGPHIDCEALEGISYEQARSHKRQGLAWRSSGC